MADNTFITGAAEGSFASAFEGLPPWATEDTAMSIETYLMKSLGVQTKMLTEAIKAASGGKGKGLSPESVEKVNDELETLFKNLKKENIEEAKAAKLRKDKAKQAEKEAADKNKLKTAGDKAMYVLGGLAAAGNKVLSANKDYLDVYDAMYKSGINVVNGNDSTADGFLVLNQLVNETGLRLQTLQEITDKYSATMNVVGMSRFSKAVGMSYTALEKSNYTSGETAELIAAMMDAEVGYSNIRGKSADQIATDAIKMGQQFSKLSLAIGMSREQMLENLKINARSVDSTMVAAGYGQKAADNILSATAGIKDMNLSKAIQQLAAASSPVFTQIYKDFTEAGMGAVGDKIANQLAIAGRTNGDPMEMANAIKSVAESISDGELNALRSQAEANNSSAKSVYEIITAMRQQGNATSNASDTQTKNATETGAAISKVNTQMEKLSAVAQAAFPPLTEQVNLLAAALKSVNNVLYKSIDSIEAETRSWAGVGLIVASLGFSLLSSASAITRFTSLFSGLSSTTSQVFRAIAGVGGVALQIIKIGSIFAALGLVLGGFTDYIAGLFGIGGKTVDKEQDDANWARMSALEKAESGLARSIESIGGFMFMDNVANEAAANRIKNETSYLDGKVGTTAKVNAPEISVPKTPMASTIDSPSSVATPPAVSADGPKQGNTTTPSVAPVMAGQPNDNGINSLLSYQSSLLEQLLLSSSDLVSVNKDLLRVTRNK